MRFRCPACQRQFRLTQDRIAPRTSAHLTCPGCHTSLLLARLDDPAVLQVSVVAAIAPTAADFFGDPGSRTPLPPLTLPRRGSSPVQPKAAGDPPDYTKLLQEFSVLFRLHTQKKRAGLRTVLGVVLGATVALAGAVLALSDATVRDVLVQWSTQAIARAAPQEAIETPQLVAEPEPPREPMSWPGLDAVVEALPRLETQVATPMLPVAPAILLPEPLRLQPEVATAIAGPPIPPPKLARRVPAVVAVRPALRERQVPPAVHALVPGGQASLAGHPKQLGTRPSAAPEPRPREREPLLDELLDEELERQRGAGPSTPPPPEP